MMAIQARIGCPFRGSFTWSLASSSGTGMTSSIPGRGDCTWSVPSSSGTGMTSSIQVYCTWQPIRMHCLGDRVQEKRDEIIKKKEGRRLTSAFPLANQIGTWTLTRLGSPFLLAIALEHHVSGAPGRSFHLDR